MRGVVGEDSSQLADRARQHVVGHEGAAPGRVEELFLGDEGSRRGGEAGEHRHDLRLDRNGGTVHDDAVQVRLNETALDREIPNQRERALFRGNLRSVDRGRGHRRSIDLAVIPAGRAAS
jgi:hypothetical protein